MLTSVDVDFLISEITLTLKNGFKKSCSSSVSHNKWIDLSQLNRSLRTAPLRVLLTFMFADFTFDLKCRTLKN